MHAGIAVYRGVVETVNTQIYSGRVDQKTGHVSLNSVPEIWLRLSGGKRNLCRARQQLHALASIFWPFEWYRIPVREFPRRAPKILDTNCSTGSRNLLIFSGRRFDEWFVAGSHSNFCSRSSSRCCSRWRIRSIHFVVSKTTVSAALAMAASG